MKIVIYKFSKKKEKIINYYKKNKNIEDIKRV